MWACGGHSYSNHQTKSNTRHFLPFLSSSTVWLVVLLVCRPRGSELRAILLSHPISIAKVLCVFRHTLCLPHHRASTIMASDSSELVTLKGPASKQHQKVRLRITFLVLPGKTCKPIATMKSRPGFESRPIHSESWPTSEGPCFLCLVLFSSRIVAPASWSC